MPLELEAKFININKAEVINKLEQIGAELVFPERLYRRCVYDIPNFPSGAWVRLRDEGDKITLTYKYVKNQKLSGVEEVEIVVEDFGKTRMFLRSIGLREKAYQESKRIRYRIAKDDVVFDLDTWPALQPWLEIEAHSEEIIRKYVKMLGFNWSEAYFGSANPVYADTYRIDPDFINTIPELLFAKEAEIVNLLNNAKS